MLSSTDGLHVRKTALKALIGSLVISGLIGIVSLVAGGFSDVQVKVLFTSLTVSGGSVLALACAAAFERGRFRTPAKVGMGLSILLTVLVLVGVWGPHWTEDYWRTVGSLLVVATALALLSLLELATLEGRFLWARAANRVASGVLAAMLIFLIWAEPDADLFFRWIGAVSIVVAVLAVTTPVLHYISKLEDRAAIGRSDSRSKAQPNPSARTLSELPKVISLADKFQLITEYWKPAVVAELNGQSVRLARVLGTFDWHQHEAEDELFLVLEGTLVIEFATGSITLQSGEAVVVPRGIKHRPVADNEVRILLFEPSTTLNPGDVVTEKTLRELPRI